MKARGRALDCRKKQARPCEVVSEGKIVFVKIFKMNKIIVFVLITIGVMSCMTNQNQNPYLSTKLSPYSEEAGFFIDGFVLEMYAKLETGLEDFQIYVGTGKLGDRSLSFTKVESLSGINHSSFRQMRRNKISSDTVKISIGDSALIALEIIHHPSTNEIQYIWLDGNNNRSEKFIITSLDHPLKEGKIFPDLTVEMLNGEKLSFNDFVGKNVVISWWHTSCAPCIAKMPGYNKLVEQYKDNSDVVFVAIAHERKERLTLFLENNEFKFIQTLANEEAQNIFGMTFPKTVIVNSERKIFYYSSGGGEYSYLFVENALKGLLE